MTFSTYALPLSLRLPQSDSLLNNLEATWTFNSASNSWSDQTLKNPDFIPSGLPLSGVGKFGTCWENTKRSGTDHLYLKDSSSTLRGAQKDFTLSIWYYPFSFRSKTNALISHGLSPNNSHYTINILRQDEGTVVTNNFKASFSVSVNNGAFSVFDQNIYNSNNWYFICVEHSNDLKRLGISVNNNPFTFNTYSGTPTPSYDPRSVPRIGKLGADIDTYGFLVAKVESFSFWNRLLTPVERSRLYQNGQGLDIKTLF